MIGYKLFTQRKDGSLGPLFINKKQRIIPGETYLAEEHLTKGFSFRPGWHICSSPNAPHLKESGRIWCKVEFEHRETLKRPENQGGVWYLGSSIKVIEVGSSSITYS